MPQPDGRALYRIELDDLNFRQGVARVQKSLTDVQRGFTAFGGSLNAITSSLGLMTGALGLAAGAGGLGLLISRSLEAADSLRTTAERIGLAVERLQELQHAARTSGASHEELERGLTQLSRRRAEARAKRQAQQPAFPTLSREEELALPPLRGRDRPSTTAELEADFTAFARVHDEFVSTPRVSGDLVAAWRRQADAADETIEQLVDLAHTQDHASLALQLYDRVIGDHQ